jgi:hypothetical protein
LRALVATLFLVGCAGDPCDGVSGTCLSARIEGSVGMLDQLAFTVDKLGTMSTPMPAGAPFSLPVRVAIQLPPSVGTPAGITVTGLSGGNGIASSGHQQVPIVANTRNSFTFTLVGGSVDLAGTGGSDGPLDGGGGSDGPPPNKVSISPTMATIPDVGRTGTAGTVTFTITNNTSGARTATMLTESIGGGGPFTPTMASTCPVQSMGLAPVPPGSCTLVMSLRTDKTGVFDDTFTVTLDDSEMIQFTIHAKVTPIWVAESLPGNTNAITGVWGSSSSDIYVTTADAGNPVWHSNGSGSWQPSPRNGCGFPLNGIFGTDASHIWAVGVQPGGPPQICTWTNNQWSSVAPMPTWTGTFRSVWASASTDIYVVSDSNQTLHSTDGLNFTLQTSGANPLYSVWGADPAHVWIAGTSGYVALRDTVSGAWTTRPSNVTSQLMSMWAAVGTDLWAVGGSPTGAGPGTIVHFDLTNGQASSESVGGSMGILNGINGRIDPGTLKPDIYAVGDIGAQVLHSDGSGSWTQIQINDGNNQGMNAVWVFPTGEVVAGGFNAQLHHLY